jgi:hypothetical protein
MWAKSMIKLVSASGFLAAAVVVCACGGIIASTGQEQDLPDSSPDVVDENTAGLRDAGTDSPAAASDAAHAVDDGSILDARAAADAGACAQLPDAGDASCRSCCGDENPAGEQYYVGQVWGCICGSGPCDTVCAKEFCQGGLLKVATPGDPCDQCIQQWMWTCKPGIEAACNSSPCLDYLDCISACP